MNSTDITRMGNIAKGYFSVSETSEYTGISERTIRDYLIDPMNPLPHYRVGVARRIIRINKDELDQWMQNFKVQTDSKIDDIINDLIEI